jgi:hypothetical protein
MGNLAAATGPSSRLNPPTNEVHLCQGNSPAFPHSMPVIWAPARL